MWRLTVLWTFGCYAFVQEMLWQDNMRSNSETSMLASQGICTSVKSYDSTQHWPGNMVELTSKGKFTSVKWSNTDRGTWWNSLPKEHFQCKMSQHWPGNMVELISQGTFYECKVVQHWPGNMVELISQGTFTSVKWSNTDQGTSWNSLPREHLRVWNDPTLTTEHGGTHFPRNIYECKVIQHWPGNMVEPPDSTVLL